MKASERTDINIEMYGVTYGTDLVERDNCVAFAKDHNGLLLPQVPFLYDGPDRLRECDATLRLGPGLTL
jgi:hypothetical protein